MQEWAKSPLRTIWFSILRSITRQQHSRWKCIKHFRVILSTVTSIFFVSISCIYWPAYRLWKDFSWEVKSWYFKFQCLPKCSHFILTKSLLSVFFLFDQLKKYPENHCFFICLFIRLFFCLFFCLFYFILFLEMYC